MNHGGRSLPLALALAATAGCAPVAAYRGPSPAAGAVTAFAAGAGGSAEDEGDGRGATASAADAAGSRRAWPLRGNTDGGRYFLGTLDLPVSAESVVVLVYGDNRPGFRVVTHNWGYPTVRRMALNNPRTWLPGLVNLPFFLVRALVPTLDGPQDLITAYITHRPNGGGERKVRRAMEAMLPADFVVSTGDLVTNGNRGRQWEDFVSRHASLRHQALYLASPGNHERMYTALARANWDAGMGPPARTERYWFAMDLPESLARFVFLDSNVMTDVRNHFPDSLEAALCDEQLAWADSMLAAPARYRFVVFHHPVISTGHYKRDWDRESDGDLSPERRDRILDICRRRGVTALFTGHEHLYHRLYVRDAAGGGFWHITTGGAGAPLYRIDPAARELQLARPMPEGLQVDLQSVFGLSTYHFCRLVIPRSPADGRQKLRLEVYRVRANGETLPLDVLDLAHSPERP